MIYTFHIDHSNLKGTEMLNPKLTISTKIQNEIDKVVNSEDLNKSQKIRSLNSLKLSRVQISTSLGIRYQFVRNVLTRELKR